MKIVEVTLKWVDNITNVQDKHMILLKNEYWGYAEKREDIHIRDVLECNRTLIMNKIFLLFFCFVISNIYYFGNFKIN